MHSLLAYCLPGSNNRPLLLDSVIYITPYICIIISRASASVPTHLQWKVTMAIKQNSLFRPNSVMFHLIVITRMHTLSGKSITLQ